MLGKKKRLLSGAITALSIFLSCSVATNVMSDSLAKNKNYKAQLQRRKTELSKELKKASEEVHKEAKNKDALDKEIKIVENQIDVSNSYISALEKEIEDIELQIEEINKNIKEKITVLKKSLYLVYVAGDTSTLDIILGAKSFEDFLDKVDIVRSVSQTIKKMIDELQADLDRVKQKEHDLQEDKKEHEEENKNLEENRKKLQTLLEESEKLLSELENSEQKVKRQIDENDAEIKAVDSQIQKYYEEQKKREEEAKKKAQESQRPVSPSESPVIYKGGFVWPVPGFRKITSGFNDIENRSHVHGAIDIAGYGAYGAKIVASGSGKIILANTNGKGGGYGNYVVIDHGNGVSTLYGHMSIVSVRVGQTVLAGQQIGNVGNTGFSTGPHLHFEYRVNGIRRNPREILVY